MNELTQLRARVKELEEIEIHLGGRVEDQRSKIRNLEERMANAAGKVLELARFIREMEANEEAWKLKESQITCDNLKQESRIRELEEAMPDVFRLRVIAGACNELRQHTAEDSLLKMADKIDKVMRKEGNERP